MKKILFIFTTIFLSCENIEEVVSYNRDLSPPSIQKLVVESSRSIRISCNENVSFISKAYLSRDGLEIENYEYEGYSFRLDFKTPLSPGKEYSSEFRIEDKNGNSLTFIARFYGYNPKVPEILINEFICKGTRSNPDKVELFIKKSGNMAGVTLFNGVSRDYDSMFIFPDIEVEEGDYITIRAVSENYPDQFIETDDLSVDIDRKFIDGVRDIRTEDLSLSSTNGVISVYSEPFGSLIDAVIYSKNSNNPEKKYRNFGLRKTLERVDMIGTESDWKGISTCIFPDDAVFVGNSTTTRSLNRITGVDTNTNEDWYTVPTSGSTFGFENSTDRY